MGRVWYGQDVVWAGCGVVWYGQGGGMGRVWCRVVVCAGCGAGCGMGRVWYGSGIRTPKKGTQAKA